MKFALTLALCGSLASAASAQEADFTDTTTADLIQELEFISALSDPLDIRKGHMTKAYESYAALAVCEGLSRNDADAALTEIATLYSGLSGEVFEPIIPNHIWGDENGRGCRNVNLALQDTAETLLEVRQQLIIKEALDIRRREITARLLQPTELSDFTDEIIADIATRSAATE